MKKIIDKKSLGVNVKKQRQMQQITVEKLSEKTGISTSHIKNIESASTSPSAEALVHIANALGVSLDVLLEDSLTGEAGRQARMGEYAMLMDDCTEDELRIATRTMETLLRELRKCREKQKDER